MKGHAVDRGFFRLRVKKSIGTTPVLVARLRTRAWVDDYNVSGCMDERDVVWPKQTIS